MCCVLPARRIWRERPSSMRRTPSRMLPHQRRPEVLHQSRRIAHGAPAARVRRRALREGVQFGESELQERQPTMFICGNNDESKKTVTGNLDQFGWETA